MVHFLGRTRHRRILCGSSGEAASVAPASAITYGAAPAMTYLAPPAVKCMALSCCTRYDLHGRGINAAPGVDVILSSPCLRAIQTAEVHHVIGSIPTPVQ